MILADLLLTNANVLSLDHESRRMGSIAVANGQITGIWPEPEPPRSDVRLIPGAQVVDLKQATVLPGFIDTHNHLLMYAQLIRQVDCRIERAKSIADIQNLIRAKAELIQGGEWILGWGYDDTLVVEKRHPTRSDLDAAAPHHPVFLRHISGHSAVVNSKALEVCGLTEEVSDPPGGHFGRDARGRLDGLLEELPAMKPVFERLPNPSMAEKVELLGVAAQEYLAQGITTCSDAAVGLDTGLDEVDAQIAAVVQGKNPMRMRFMVFHQLLREGGPFGDLSAGELDALIRNRSENRASLDSAKLFQDGSIQLTTAALRVPYHCAREKYGSLMHHQDALNEEVANLHQRGFRVAIHGNGDRAIKSILDAYEFALQKAPRKDHRHRIEHVQAATPEDLQRMARLDVAASFFINHVYYWGDRHQKLFLGPERASRINPLAEAVDQNLLFTLHSDCPITPISPLFSVWAAVNRTTRDGHTLGPLQRCPVEVALRAMTSMGAELNFEEQSSGSIEIGKRADFAVLEEDPTQVDPAVIKDIPVLATLIDGKVVYGKSL